MPDLGVLVRQLQGALGGRALAAGQSTVSFSAASVSASKVVTHGLGSMPTFAACVPNNNTGIAYSVVARTATTITVQGWTTAGGSITSTPTFDWLVIG